MGLKLGRLLGKVARIAVPVAGGFATGGFGGAAMAGLQLAGRRRGPTFGPVAAGVPSIQQVTGVSPFFAQPSNGEIVPVAAGAVALPALAMGMTRAVVGAIMRLGGALGIAVTAKNIGRVGMRLWRTINTFARRHPGISILTWLASLGLLAEEAAEFMLWGQAKQRRRRGRGISARDIRISRRTIRKVAAFQRDLVGLHRHPRRARGGDVTRIVRAG